MRMRNMNCRSDSFRAICEVPFGDDYWPIAAVCEQGTEPIGIDPQPSSQAFAYRSLRIESADI